MKYLNLGCGSRFHPNWTNIDISSPDPSVKAHDLSEGIPYPDDTFDVVYHSHILEHFPRHEALVFLKECFRVLKSNGIIRVVVPDLEKITRIYLEALEKACAGDIEWQQHYEWLILEFYDQAVRESSGGAMLEYMSQENVPNASFLSERMGGEFRRIKAHPPKKSTPSKSQKSNWFHYLRRFPGALRMKCVQILLGHQKYRALQIGLFRSSGEVHHWMYDRYSLAQLLKRAGFRNPVHCDASKSQIANWEAFELDTEPDGRVYKPDSLYMEAFKS